MTVSSIFLQKHVFFDNSRNIRRIYNLNAFMNGEIQDCIDHLIVAENAERMKESEL